MSTFSHTPETDQRIRDGYRVNEPVCEIAAALNVSRNTVIGRARRLGLNRTWRTKVGHDRFMSDPARREAHAKSLSRPRPAQALWWASREVEEKYDHIRKLQAGRAAAIRKRGEA